MSAWKKATLGDVAGFIRGINFKPDDVQSVEAPGAVACMRTKNVQAELDLTDVWGVEERFVRREEQFLLPGDILVSSANSWNLVGKCSWIPELPWRASFGGFVCVLRADRAQIEPRYLFHWFASDRIQALARSFGQKTTNISNLNIDRCLKLEFPIPPLADQRRIAEVLDRAEALRAKRRAALSQLDALVLASFDDLFATKLSGSVVDTLEKQEEIPQGWSWLPLSEVARLATGHTPDREREDYWGGDIPWISLTDIRQLDGTVAAQTLQNVTSLGISRSSAVCLPRGTVCFSRTASIGFVTVMGREMATSQDFVNWVCSPRLDPIYLMWALIISRPRLKAISTGSTHKTIYMRVAEQFRLLVPPLDLQLAFAHRVTAIEALKTTHRAALTELDALFASLQHRAFRGEL